MGSAFFSVMAMLANAWATPFVMALVIGVPSALLYCLELWEIIANFAHFRSSFFVLVIVRGICSIASYLFAFFAHRFGKIGLFLALYLRLPRFVLALMLFVGYYAFHLENLLTAFLLLNRFSAILMPLNYEKFWHRHGLPLGLVITFILPLPFTAPIFGLGMYIHVQHDNATFTLDDHKTSNELNSSEIAAWSAILFAVICLLLNLASLFAYKLCSCQNASLQNQTNAKFERKMTIYTVLTFFGQLIMAIFMIIIFVTSSNYVDEHGNRYSYAERWLNISSEMGDLLFLANFNQNPWVNDLTTVAIPAWLLLWASTKMREILANKSAKLINRILKQKLPNTNHQSKQNRTISVRNENGKAMPKSLSINRKT